MPSSSGRLICVGRGEPTIADAAREFEIGTGRSASGCDTAFRSRGPGWPSRVDHRRPQPLTRLRGPDNDGHVRQQRRPDTRVRTRRRRALDAAAARIFKMPPGRHDYTLTQAVRVPMRDGVELLTDIYAPVGKSLGTLLIRTPYGRTGLIALLTAGYYATHGYHVVNQSCRGTFGSGGDFEPFSHEVDDGADTLAWLRKPKPGSADDSRCAEPLIWGIRLGPC
jgi:hypothetical protein